MELRPYQIECIDRVVNSFEQDPHGEELITLPTGTGKTVIFCEILRRLAKRPIILAHRDDLLNQAADKYHAIQPEAIISKVVGGHHEYGGEIILASVQTVWRPKHLAKLQERGCDVLIIDEGHHAAAGTYQKVIKALSDAFHLYFTATPERLDGKPIIDKPPLYEQPIVPMIEQGFLCDVRAIAIRTTTSLDGVHTRMGDYSEGELDMAINTPERNFRVAEAYKEHADGRRAICFAVTVKHAANLANAFIEQDVPAGMVCGTTPPEERQRLYAALRSGEIKVLVSVMVLTEGFDEPTVNCVIMARPTKSRGLYIQCAGRGLRLAPDKPDCLILDLTDNTMRYSLASQSLDKALGVDMRDGESVKENKSRQAMFTQARKLREARTKDVVVNITHPDRFTWEKEFSEFYGADVYKTSINGDRFQIQLTPAFGKPNLYWVGARFHPPDYYTQKWADPLPFEWAKQFAEDRLVELARDASKISLFDTNALWRKKRVDMQSRQVTTMRELGIEITPGMSKGKASDLISVRKAMGKYLAVLASDLGVEVGKTPCNRCGCLLSYQLPGSESHFCVRCYPKRDWSDEQWQKLATLPRKHGGRESA